MRILAVGTYPIRLPIHGGQRRVHAISLAMQSANITYQYLSIYRRDLYPKDAVDKTDFPLGATRTRFDMAHFVDDLRAGLFVEYSQHIVAKIYKIAVRLEATHIQLEQPFVYPIYERLKSLTGLDHLKLIYSSQNVESPLKRAVLTKYNTDHDLVDEACALIEKWERAAVTQSELVIAVTEEDAHIYRGWGAKRILVCRNGVGDFPVDPSMRQKIRSIFESRPFAMMVGSAYPLNANGFLSLVADPAISFLPPRLAIAVAGGMGHGVWQHPIYQAARAINDRRARFFSEINDSELGALKEACHVFVLPIVDGGGSNLKTAEALVSGKHIIGTGVAFRGYDEFKNDEGVTIADDARSFRAALRDVLQQPPLNISNASHARREALYWPHILQALVGELKSDALRRPDASIYVRQCTDTEAWPEPGHETGSVTSGQGLKQITVEMMGRPIELFGYQEDRYFVDILSYIPQNKAFMSLVMRLPPNGVIIDVGANIGITTLIGALCVPDGQVFSLEPSPRAFACLEAMKCANKLTNCQLFNVAAGTTPGKLSFCESDFIAQSYICATTEDRGNIDVLVTTLDALVAEKRLNRVDIVKIDVEGFELDVLKGAEKMISRYRPTFLMEFNSFAICCNRNISPRVLIDYVLEKFGHFSFEHDGVTTLVSTREQARDFIYSNMVSRASIDDIVFGGI